MTGGGRTRPDKKKDCETTRQDSGAETWEATDVGEKAHWAAMADETPGPKQMENKYMTMQQMGCGKLLHMLQAINVKHHERHVPESSANKGQNIKEAPSMLMTHASFTLELPKNQHKMYTLPSLSLCTLLNNCTKTNHARLARQRLTPNYSSETDITQADKHSKSCPTSITQHSSAVGMPCKANT